MQGISPSPHLVRGEWNEIVGEKGSRSTRLEDFSTKPITRDNFHPSGKQQTILESPSVRYRIHAVVCFGREQVDALDLKKISSERRRELELPLGKMLTPFIFPNMEYSNDRQYQHKISKT